jgi:hypothetical protein
LLSFLPFGLHDRKGSGKEFTFEISRVYIALSIEASKSLHQLSAIGFCLLGSLARHSLASALHESRSCHR